MTLPISSSIGLNDIRIELGIPSQSPTTLISASRGDYVPINQSSTYKPNSVPPFTFSSWWGYDHSASSGLKFFMGGSFSTYQDISRNRIVRLNEGGSYDTSFNIGTGFSSTINTISIQSDSKIIIGGFFTLYQPIFSNRIAQLNTDGSYDTSFNIGTGFNINVNTIAIQSDSKVLVGGTFTTYQGTTRNRIARLNTDGSYDTSFNIGTGFNSTINTIAIQSDSKVLVGGAFTTYQGTTATNRIARLNTDGTYDTSFTTDSGFNIGVSTIAIQSDSKVLVGGAFTTYRTLPKNRIARLNTDGSYDTSFNIGTGFNSNVNTIAIQSDGKVLIGGTFTTYQGTTRNRIIRLNTDGSEDTSFNIGTGFNNTVSTISIQSDDKILVGGTFTTYQGTTRNRIIRLNTDGSEDTSFNIGSGFGNTVNKISIQSDGKILVGGFFSSYQDIIKNRIIRLNTDGSEDTSFNIGSGSNGNIVTTLIRPDGKVLIGGTFTTYQGIIRSRITRLNTDGSNDASFFTGIGFNNNVFTTTIQSDGKILVGGDFTIYQNSFNINSNFHFVTRIVRLNTDGTYDPSFSMLNGFNNIVNTIVIQPSDNFILVGGTFTSYNGISTNQITRLNTDGSLDTTFNIGTGFGSSVVNAIAIQSDDKIIVGGGFGSYDGVTSNRIIRLNFDGSLDTTFNIGTGFDNTVQTIAIQSDGKILVGGTFSTYQDVTRYAIIRLNEDGSEDTSFNIGFGFLTNDVRSIYIQSDGKILVGGDFTTYNNDPTPKNRIIRLNIDGSEDTSFNMGTGFNGPVLCIT
jgi:uncharacterized delta-60 repeat protein